MASLLFTQDSQCEAAFFLFMLCFYVLRDGMATWGLIACTYSCIIVVFINTYLNLAFILIHLNLIIVVVTIGGIPTMGIMLKLLAVLIAELEK